MFFLAGKIAPQSELLMAASIRDRLQTFLRIGVSEERQKNKLDP
jgi:hypothetical protein